MRGHPSLSTMRSLLFFGLILAFSSFRSPAFAQIGCRDENNNIVDWFYLYKLPRHSKWNGLEFVYITATKHSAWQQSELKVDEAGSIPGLTITQLYKNNSAIAAVLYNDEPPSTKTDPVRGHTKGVMASGAESGFWLVHSVPHYPPTLEEAHYGYPETGHLYGQSFLCISLPSGELNKAAGQLLYNEPHIYSYSAPDSLKEKLSNLFKAIAKETASQQPFFKVVELRSSAGTSFQSFAKSRQFHKDLYEDLLAPHLQSDFDVESWQHGTGNLQSNCSSTNKVLNVKEVKIPEVNYEFPTLKDHSKWAVSTTKDSWVCVGDINRQEHQKMRGGGTVCLKDSSVWTAYKKLVAEVEPCRNSSPSVLQRVRDWWNSLF